jgi:hypothetical protein
LASAHCSGAQVSPRLLINGSLSLILSSASGIGQGLAWNPMPRVPKARARCGPMGAALSSTLLTKSHMGHDTRGQNPSVSFRGSGAFGLARQSLTLDAFATTEVSRRALGGGQSKLTRPDGQSIRAKQPNDAQGFSGSTTMPRSIHTMTTPS